MQLIFCRLFSALCSGLTLIAPPGFEAAAAEKPRKIVLLAGPITGHPKETHEYEKNVILLKHLLETSPDLQGKVRVEAHFKGWPKDPSTLDDADTIFLASDGCDQRETDHPFYVGDRLNVIERQMKRGCGLVLFHWSTFNPARFRDPITEWVGGYFDYEMGKTANKWYSAIQTWQATATPGSPNHPILRGVKPFTTQEEFYYRIRFRDNDPRLKSILLTRPPNETNDFAVGWAVERADGGRGFGFTGGHFYANWWNADFRKLVLNTIVWTAKLDMPAQGVRSEPFERFKALILTGHNHPAHDWRATTAALILAIEQDPRAIVHVTEYVEDLTNPPRSPRREEGDDPIPPPYVGGYNVFDYDLLVLNYCNWERPRLSGAARTNFVHYLQNGGGLAIVHFANGAWHPSLPKTTPEDAWPEYYKRICRRVWEHRPPNASGHDAYGPFRVELAATKHPIIDGLHPFDTVDELYYRQAGDVPIEPLAYALSKHTKQREPMIWAYDYGKGRVFQTVLGHSDESIRKAAALIRRGCVWAVKRDQISFDPPVELTEGALFRSGSPWTPRESQKRADGILPAEGKAQPAGTPAISGLEPAAQQEKDWVDSRWSQTDVGQLLASTLHLPNGTVTKALSIRVGDNNEATVCFDTQNLNLRAGWTGGFLKLDPARFGLIRAPRIDGDVQFLNAPGAGSTGAPGRFSGFHVHGKRVVLEYEIDDASVIESPWCERTAHGLVFLRHLEIAPHRDSLLWSIVSPEKGSQPALETHIVTRSGPGGTSVERETTRVLWTNNAVVHIASVFGRQGPTKLLNDRGLHLEAPAADHSVQLTVAYWQGSPAQAEAYRTWEKDNLREVDLKPWQVPGPARWLPALVTAGQLAPDSAPLVIDTLTVPYENPWNALMFLSGVDFTSDGAAYVSSIHGDVWKVTGIDDKLRKLTWKRFATGLFQPLGLKVVNDNVYVLGRDQITRLQDENGDSEADYYENFFNLIDTSAGGHDYVTSLEVDSAGNFHYVDPRGAHRVPPDGRTKETLATGFRNPNGLGVSPDGGVITVAPQQGEWTPSSAIIEVKRGGYYGYGGPKVTPERPLGYDAPLCWLPHSMDNSGGSQVWVPTNHWGPLAGQMLHLSWGRCSMMLVARDVVSGVPQGAAVQLPGRFLSGPMRGSFNPRDGHLYVVGSTGWQTSALKDGCFQRARYTGKPLRIPIAWHTYQDGLTMTFDEPLDKETAEDVGSYDVQVWNYRYAAQYGSKDWSVANPGKEGPDTLSVKSARLAADGRTVFLQIAGLRPVMQLQVQYNLESKQAARVRGKLFATINRLGQPFQSFPPHR